MTNRVVSLYLKCKTPEGWERYPVRLANNGKIKPNAAIVGGVEQVFEKGHYELRHFEGTKTVWTRIEGNASDALAR